jgi:glycosyltransferase involved in cell wall biosynthesis
MTPLGEGGKGGIDRLMDAVRAELRQSPLADVSVRFLVTRGQSSAVAPFVFLRSMLLLICMAATSSYDVAHINLSADSSTWRKSLLASICRLFRIPYVIHLHSGRYHTFWSSQRPAIRRYIDRMFDQAATIVVLGSAWRELICRNIPAAAERVTVLPNATRSIPETRGPGSENTHILFLGRLGPHKGIPELLRALDRLRDTGTWRATLAGDGDVEKTKTSISDLGMQDRISVPGWVDSRGTDELLRSADILVLPSHGENLPMCIVEGFGHGLAVVATPVGSIPDILEDRRTGLLVPVGDVGALQTALQDLIGNPELRLHLGEAARREHKARLDLTIYVKHLGEIWKGAVAGRSLGSPAPGDVDRSVTACRIEST